MAATVQSVLNDIGTLNTEVQQIRDFLTANPPANPGAIQQLSDNVAVVKANIGNLAAQLGVAITT